MKRSPEDQPIGTRVMPAREVRFAPPDAPKCTVCGGTRLVKNGALGACSYLGCKDPTHDVGVEDGRRTADATTGGEGCPDGSTRAPSSAGAGSPSPSSAGSSSAANGERAPASAQPAWSLYALSQAEEPEEWKRLHRVEIAARNLRASWREPGKDAAAGQLAMVLDAVDLERIKESETPERRSASRPTPTEGCTWEEAVVISRARALRDAMLSSDHETRATKYNSQWASLHNAFDSLDASKTARVSSNASSGVTCSDGTEPDEPADRGFVCQHEHDADVLREQLMVMTMRAEFAESALLSEVGVPTRAWLEGENEQLRRSLSAALVRVEALAIRAGEAEAGRETGSASVGRQEGMSFAAALRVVDAARAWRENRGSTEVEWKIDKEGYALAKLLDALPCASLDHEEQAAVDAAIAHEDDCAADSSSLERLKKKLAVAEQTITASALASRDAETRGYERGWAAAMAARDEQ